MSTPHMLLPITHRPEGWVWRCTCGDRGQLAPDREAARQSLVPVWPEAACRGSGLDWFPSRHDLRAEAAAINVCRTCPHQVECLAWAVEHDECGIWGGVTERERRRVRDRGRREIRHGTEAGAVEHRRQGIPTCDECATARLAAERARRARRRAQ